MAVLQALLAYLARSAGKIVSTLFGWAQSLERKVKALWRRRGARPGLDRAAIDALSRELLALDVPYDDWQTVYRELLQLDRERAGHGPLLQRSVGDTVGERPRQDGRYRSLAGRLVVTAAERWLQGLRIGSK